MSQAPFVTVLMPVRNEADFIERSLGAVLEQSYPADRMEILVLDGCSSDGTPALVHDLARRFPEHDLRVLENPGRIVSTGLNLGLRRARGEVLVRVDGHCEIGRDFVAEGVRHLRDGAAAGVGGPLVTIGATPTARAIATAMSSRFGVGGSAFRTVSELAEPLEVDTVAFPAYTRRAIAEAGAFDEELVRNQDDEYNFRLRRLGHRVLLVPEMPARYSSRATLSRLARQYAQYGFWKVRVLQKHPRQMSWRHFAPPALVALLVVTASMSPFLGPLWPLGMLPTVLYGAAVLAASLRIGRGEAPSVALRLPAAFAVLHLAYGLGFWVGLVRFAHRWRDRTGRVPELDWSRSGGSAS